ncbi:transcription factor S, partial [Thermococci archaeon]
MKFCPKCGNIMLPDKKRGVFVCRKCGYEEPLDPEAASKYKITQKIKHEREDIPVIEQDVATLPKVKVICPKCGNDEAYWWELQTRAGDEPSTIFY